MNGIREIISSLWKKTTAKGKDMPLSEIESKAENDIHELLKVLDETIELLKSHDITDLADSLKKYRNWMS